MDRFKTAFANTIGYEGGYSFDPNDRGGETYKGISRKYYPKWKGWQIIDIYKTKYSGSELDANMAQNEGLQSLVEQFYHENYWLPMQLDSFGQAVVNELFDTSVNQGKWSAVSYLQKALNKLNRNQEDYPDIDMDGQMGNQTLSAYLAYMDTRKFASRNADKLTEWLVRWLNYYQLQKYDQITIKDAGQEIYIPGWTERS